jgi:hypothetical protein
MVGGGEGAFIGAVHRIAGAWTTATNWWRAHCQQCPESGAARRRLGLDPARSYADYRRWRGGSARPDGIEAVASSRRTTCTRRSPAPSWKPASTSSATSRWRSRWPKAQALAALAREARLLRRDHTYAAIRWCAMPAPWSRRARTGRGPPGAGGVRRRTGWPRPLEQECGQKQANNWRNDPARAARRRLGDIGTHAYHLADTIVSGMPPSSCCAELSPSCRARRWTTTCRCCCATPRRARHAVGQPGRDRLRKRLRCACTAAGPASVRAGKRRTSCGSRRRAVRPAPDARPRTTALLRRPPRACPSGHPEGYLEAFAQLYRDAAGAPAAASAWLSTADDGVAGLAFVEAALQSQRAGGVWTALPTPHRRAAS